MLFRFGVLCLGAAALCGATTINFDDASTGVLTTFYTGSDGVTFSGQSDGSGGCTSTSGCEFKVVAASGGTTTETDPNFVALTGNNGVVLEVSFNAPVTLNSIDLLGMGAGSGGFYDNGTIELFNSSNAEIGSAFNISSVTQSSTAISPSTYNFGNVANVSYFTISRGSANSGLLGFDDLNYTPSGVPEPASFLLIGGGMIGVLLARRRKIRS